MLISSAPTLDQLQRLAEISLDRLPIEFRSHLQNVIIRVEDFPEDAMLAELELDDPFDLLGLYQGVALTDQSVEDTGRTPDIIFLFRRPLLDYWCETEETLDHVVRHVLVHEIGHHFGFSDDDMEAIEAEMDQAADKFRLSGN
jgi:predicted Zn-dependent protease with MMP-like domain